MVLGPHGRHLSAHNVTVSQLLGQLELQFHVVPAPIHFQLMEVRSAVDPT